MIKITGSFELSLNSDTPEIFPFPTSSMLYFLFYQNINGLGALLENRNDDNYNKNAYKNKIIIMIIMMITIRITIIIMRKMIIVMRNIIIIM